MNATGKTGSGTMDNALDSIEALEAKVGADSSAVATSLDYLVTNASSSNPGHKHTLAQGATDVTSSAAELNILDGVTATAAELNHLAGVTSTAAELNITDGGNTTERAINIMPKCKAYLNAAQTGLVDTVSTIVNLDTEVYDIGSDFNTTTHLFTAPITGYYLIIGNVAFTSVVTAKQYQARIMVDANLVAVTDAVIGAALDPYVHVSSIEAVAAGSTIGLYAVSNSGDNTTNLVNSYVYPCYMSVHLLSV